jgi:hypothetical protein
MTPQTTNTTSQNPPYQKPIRLHYQEVLALLAIVEDTITDETGRLDFSQLSHTELRAYARLGEMKKAQESFVSLSANMQQTKQEDQK